MSRRLRPRCRNRQPTKRTSRGANRWRPTGRLRDALHEIDRIPVGDPLRADADRLRSDIQRQFLAIAAAELPGADGAVSEPPQRPPE